MDGDDHQLKLIFSYAQSIQSHYPTNGYEYNFNPTGALSLSLSLSQAHTINLLSFIPII